MPPVARSSSLEDLLGGVSRSFGLSIRLLPRPLRHPVGVAYLLARATDTVADAADVAAADRLALLGQLEMGFDSPSPSGLAPAMRRILRATHHERERELLARIDECIAALSMLREDDRQDVRAVLRHIVRGQSLDLERFSSPADLRALPNAAALEEYAYLVAGCVGEFWTDLCARHLDGFARRDVATMRSLGRSFGMGLQLVNIVRDAGEDLANGRCYFPLDELAAAGLVPGEIRTQADRFLSVWRHWQDAAAHRLADGMSYADAVHSRRVRAAVALPALLGRRTLVLVRAAGTRALRDRIKVPRSDVRRILLRTALGLASRGVLRTQWDNAAR